MNTNQMVVAKLDGQRFRVKVLPDYDWALRQWYPLDEALRSGRLAILGPTTLTHNVATGHVVEPRTGNYLAVRSADDPEWSQVPTVKLAALRPGRGVQSFGAVVKKLATEQGFHGHPGGWLYRGGPSTGHRAGQQGCRLTSSQGFGSWWARHGKPGHIVAINRRYHLTEKENAS